MSTEQTLTEALMILIGLAVVGGGVVFGVISLFNKSGKGRRGKRLP